MLGGRVGLTSHEWWLVVSNIVYVPFLKVVKRISTTVEGNHLGTGKNPCFGAIYKGEITSFTIGKGPGL